MYDKHFDNCKNYYMLTSRISTLHNIRWIIIQSVVLCIESVPKRRFNGFFQADIIFQFLMPQMKPVYSPQPWQNKDPDLSLLWCPMATRSQFIRLVVKPSSFTWPCCLFPFLLSAIIVINKQKNMRRGTERLILVFAGTWNPNWRKHTHFCSLKWRHLSTILLS